ncbi:37S ribosomal protein Rsm22 [Diplocarpon rosae]|nr:37S ribosomal protein Rsm22 [Diplocarpon rosae]
MMLSARKIPRACQSCRLQLLSLFENGFTNCAPVRASQARYSTRLQPRARNLQHRPNTFSRVFSTTRKRADGQHGELPEQPGACAADIEAVVRQARQTFGETLPKDYLSAEEYLLYERLYGAPLRETRAEDLEFLPGEEGELDPEKVRNVLLRQNELGQYEEIEFDPKLGYSVTDEGPQLVQTEEIYLGGTEEFSEDDTTAQVLAEASGELPSAEKEAVAVVQEVQEHAIKAQIRNQREDDAIARLRVDMEAAMARQSIEPAEEIEEEYEEEEEKIEAEEGEEEEDDGPWISSDSVRTHPHTMIGRTGSNPTTLSLPSASFVAPITELLARSSMKHISETAERVFGGKGLPYSSSVPASKKMLPQKNIGLDAVQYKMSEIEADAYIGAVMPGTYAAVTSTLVEVRKRLGSKWIRDLLCRAGGEGPRVLDAGAAGAGAIAWREILQAEWDVMREEGLVKEEQAVHGKTSVLTGSTALRHRVSRFLDNTTFLPRLPDYIHSSSKKPHLDRNENQPRKSYDIIIAPHTLFPLKEEFRRKNMVHNLWSLLEPNGGVLILIEKGLPRGFEAIAGARNLLLEHHISSPGETAVENEITSPESEHARFTEKEEGMIIAPCTNHKKCPMYPIPGLSTGRKDFCHFPQRFIRPAFLQSILGARVRNHEDSKFSYIAVRRGVDARRHSPGLPQGEEATVQSFAGYEDLEPESDGQAVRREFDPLILPRIILPSLKRRGHVTLDLCTPSGKLERWTVPRSFSKAAYRDARKSSWGDLWALGAKTRTFRLPRLGRVGDNGKNGKLKGIRDGKMGKGGKKMKKNKFDLIMGKDGLEAIKEDPSQSRFVKREKRTKGGRIWKEPKPIGENDL